MVKISFGENLNTLTPYYYDHGHIKVYGAEEGRQKYEASPLEYLHGNDSNANT